MSVIWSQVRWTGRIQNRRTQRKQMHHQIPTSSRDGATKPQLKMFCDVKHRYKPEACGLCEVGGGAYLLPNTSLFTPRRQLWHPPALPETFPMLLASYFLTTTHRPAAQAHGWVRAPHVPLLPSAPRSAPWRVQDEQEAVIMWSLRFMQHQKNNNKKKTIKKGPVHEWRNLDFVLKLKLQWDLCKSFLQETVDVLFWWFFFCWAQRLWDPLARLHLRIDTFVKSSWWTQRGRKTAPPDPQRPLRA